MMKEKSADKMRELLPKSNRVLAAREVAQTKLIQAGVLAKDLVLPADLEVVRDEELEQLGVMRPGARPSEELVAEDRGH